LAPISRQVIFRAEDDVTEIADGEDKETDKRDDGVGEGIEEDKEID